MVNVEIFKRITCLRNSNCNYLLYNKHLQINYRLINVQIYWGRVTSSGLDIVIAS